MTNVHDEGARVVRELVSNYIADAILTSPALLGSVELLGNPTGLIRGVGAGIRCVRGVGVIL